MFRIILFFYSLMKLTGQMSSQNDPLQLIVDTNKFWSAGFSEMLCGRFWELSLVDSVLWCDFQIHSVNYNLVVNFCSKFQLSTTFLSHGFVLALAALFQAADQAQ